MITAPMVLLIVGITGPRPIVKCELGGWSRDDGGGWAPNKHPGYGDEEEWEQCGAQEHGIKCRHTQYYKSPWVRWAENGQAGTHGKDRS